MSYDLHLMRKDAVGDDSAAAYERLFDPERDAGDAADRHRDVHQRLIEKYGSEPAARHPWWRRLLSRG